MLYAASSLPLACLEVLVHLMPGQIPPAYVFSSAKLNRRPHLADFRGDVEDEISTRRYGQWWANDRSSVAILVPSVVIPSERNILLNPTHSDFGTIVWDQPEPFAFDRRLLRTVSP